MVRKQAVPRGSLWLGLQDPGGRWGRGGPERRALPSAPSGLAEDKEKRVQAGRGGAHTLTCIPGVAQVTQRAQTGTVDRQGDMQTGHACGHTWGAATVGRSPAEVCQSSPTLPTSSDWGPPQPWMPSTAGDPECGYKMGHRGQTGAKSSTRVPRE